MNKEELEYQRETEKIIHDYHMEEIEEKRKSEELIENLRHQHQLELQRIKSSEIKKSIEWKKNNKFAENYWKNNPNCN